MRGGGRATGSTGGTRFRVFPQPPFADPSALPEIIEVSSPAGSIGPGPADERMYFVDLPGYGYAKAPRAVKETFGGMIESYLLDREQLKLAVILVDCRMPPTDSDKMMKQWMDHHHIPNAVVLTKADKISRNQLNQALRTSVQSLNTKEIVPFSAVTGSGKDELLTRIRAAIDHIPQ